MLSKDPRLELLKQVKETYQLQTPESLQSLPEPKMLIENFLPVNSVVGVTAAPGVGKTWLMMELMRSACVGKFLGEFKWTLDLPRILFVGSDASMYDYARQWRRIYAEQRALEDKIDAANLWKAPEGVHDSRPADLQIDFLLQSSFMLDDLGEVLRLIKTAETRYIPGEYHTTVHDVAYSVGEDEWEVEQEQDIQVIREERRGWNVIVFDTLSRLTRANQNDNTEMENVFRNIRFIAEQTGATCILLHHNSKKSEHNGGEDWRGAVAQIGALDCWLQLRPTKNNKYIISAEFKKFRGLTPEPFLYHMNVNTAGPASLQHVQNKTGRTVNYDLMTQHLYEFISASDTPVSRKEIADGIWTKVADLCKGDRAVFSMRLKERLKALKDPKFFADKSLYVLPKKTSAPNEERLYHWTTEEDGEED